MKLAAFKRLVARTSLLLWAAAGYAFRLRARPVKPETILIVSRFLLGDTLMLAPLFAALRHHYPGARLFLAVQSKFLPLFSLQPYGVTALAFDLEDPQSVRQLRRRGPFDLAVVPGENRNAIAARAFRSRWIVAIDGDRPAWKNFICDELIPLSARMGTIYDAFVELAGPDLGLRHRQGDWTVPATPSGIPDLQHRPYVILHVGSSSAGRRWPAELWRKLADILSENGHRIFWSAGPGEEAIAREIDPAGRYTDTSGRLDLLQLWTFVKEAALLISADTGIVHMAKLNGCATVCLYGPGGEMLVGKGHFFRDARIQGVVVPHFRDRRDGRVFKRQMPWAKGWRGPVADEPRPDPEQQLQAVVDAAYALLHAYRQPTT
jgi:ADP-heptose:LPS heptosyltransferase